MDIEYLKRFVLLGQTLSFRKTADDLFISQPTLSHSISAMEKELGISLLIRDTKSVRLTPAGITFLSAAQEIIKTYDSVTSRLISALDKEEKILHIGYVGPALGRSLSPWVQSFHESNPEIELRLTRHHSTEIREALDTNSIQLALLYEEYAKTIPGIKYEIVSREKFRLLVNSKSRFALRSSVSLDEIKDEPLLIGSRSSSPLYHDKVLSLFSSHGISPKIDQEIRLVSDIYRLVDMNLGYAVMSFSDTSFYNSFDLTFVNIAGIDANELIHNRVIAWKGDLTPAAQAFKRMIENTTLKNFSGT